MYITDNMVQRGLVLGITGSQSQAPAGLEGFSALDASEILPSGQWHQDLKFKELF
jgi:hypothetical protein